MKTTRKTKIRVRLYLALLSALFLPGLVASAARAQMTSLTATAGTRQVSLSWRTVPSTVSYSVYRSVSAAGPWGWPVKTGLASTATTYVDTGLVSGKSYFYKVGAMDSRKWCRLSLVATAKPK